MAFCRRDNEEARCGCCPQPTSSQHFGSALGVPEPSFYTGMFNKVDPYSILESHSVLVIVSLLKGHWHTDLLVKVSLVLFHWQFWQQETSLLLLLQKGAWKLVRNATAKDWFLRNIWMPNSLWGLWPKLASFPNIVLLQVLKETRKKRAITMRQIKARHLIKCKLDSSHSLLLSDYEFEYNK